MRNLLNYFVATVLLSSVAFSQHVYANNQTVSEPRKPVWSVDCNNHTSPDQLTCLMQQTVFAGKTNRRIFSATIRKVRDKHLLILALPHGLNLLEGVKVSIDSGEAKTYPIHTADINGAYANIVLTDDMSDSMRAGNILSLNVMASSANAIELQLSLAGFSAAYDLLRKF